MLSLNRNRFIFSFLFIGVLLPAAWADQVGLKNGDRVTGGIIKKDGKNLTIKTDQFGVVVIPWDQVDSITAEKPLHIVLDDGRTLEGTLKTADGKIEVTTPLELQYAFDANLGRILLGRRIQPETELRHNADPELPDVQ